VSHTIVTTLLASVCSRQYLSAAASSSPAELPPSTPSFRSSSRAAANASASLML
jgi:hypothetical protein